MEIKTDKSAIFIFGILTIFIHILGLSLLQEYFKTGISIIIIGILCDLLLYYLVKLDNLNQNLKIPKVPKIPKIPQNILKILKIPQNILKITITGILAFVFHLSSLFVLFSGKIFLGLSLGLIGILYDILLYFCIDEDNRKFAKLPKETYNWKIILFVGILALIWHVLTMAILATFGVIYGLVLGKISILWDIILFVLVKANNKEIKKEN